jgi:uncharacterized membrane protein/thiol-disulfide isomerase/thioredoxin
MMKNPTGFRLLLLALVLTVLPASKAGGPAVHVALFYSPSCPHCHKVIDEHLPPLLEKYGGQLVVVGINTLIPDGQELFQAVMAHFGIPREEWGVPALVIGETLLKGGLEIPRELPRLVEAGIARGGIGWPELAGLKGVLEAKEAAARARRSAAAGGSEKTAAGTGETFTREMTLAQKLARDPVGNSLALVVLAGMILSLIGVGRRLRGASVQAGAWPRWSVPTLACFGLGVAGYLSFVEVNQVAAVCGPVGDCNTVQQSPYARLFGVFPVALLGLAAYAAIAAAWLVQRYSPLRLQGVAALALWTLALMGTLFSIYFTYLEPFVIGATCLWCLASAVIMTLLLWATTVPAQSAWQAMRTGDGGAER